MKFMKLKAAAFAAAGLGVAAFSTSSAYADDCGRPRSYDSRGSRGSDHRHAQGTYVRSYSTSYRTPRAYCAPARRVIVRERPVCVTPYYGTSYGYAYPYSYSHGGRSYCR